MLLATQRYQPTQIVDEQRHPSDLPAAPRGSAVAAEVNRISRQAGVGEPSGNVCIAATVLEAAVRENDHAPRVGPGQPRLPVQRQPARCRQSSFFM
jgi:hypothetical protein